jgi:sugar/nucleoside kinase (ribokinase family)
MAREPRSEDFEVGYGKPPKHSQFQAGCSGNPKGRPKGSKNLATQLSDALSEKVVITKDGRRLKVSKFEVILTQVVNKSAGGDLNAARLVISLLQGMEVQAAQELAQKPNAEERSLAKEDASVLANLNARLFGKREPSDA